jgi:hypothetical protein
MDSSESTIKDNILKQLDDDYGIKIEIINCLNEIEIFLQQCGDLS